VPGAALLIAAHRRRAASLIAFRAAALIVRFSRRASRLESSASRDWMLLPAVGRDGALVLAGLRSLPIGDYARD